MTEPDPRIPAPAATQRVRLIQQRWPAAAQLARLLSLAVRIEPSLLRATRLAVGLDAAAEADLWFSGIIASSGTLGISFVPAVAEALRRELAASPDERALAWNLLKQHHGQQPWSIRLEERINYLTTGSPNEASEIEDLLAAALAELHEVRARDEQAALGIARWLLAALARAPAAARATPTAAAAELAAGVQLDGRLGGADQLTQAENSDLLPWLLDHLGTTVLPVRLLPGAVALGGDPPDGIPLPVPVTDPLVVSVIWGSGSDARHEHVRVTPGEELLVPVEADEVELRTLADGGVVLRRAGIGRILVSGIDQGAGFAIADYAILTAARVLGDWALPSGPPRDPAGSLASDAPAVEAESSGDAEAGTSASGPAPDLIYIPEDGEPLNVRVVATDSELGVTLLKPERPAPAILPVGQIQPGQKWRLQVLPGRDQTGSRQGFDAPAVSFSGVTTSGNPYPMFSITPQQGRGPSLPGQSGAAITLGNPWGAVIGLLLAETTDVVKVVSEQPQAGEAKTVTGLQALLRAASIDAIVASFNLARQITPATAALVDGKWPETQPLEDLIVLPLRNGALPVLADIEPAQLGFSPGPSARTMTPTLQSALTASAFVVFAASPRAPSWEAYRAVRAELPEARLLVPNARPGTLMALTTHADLTAYPQRVVVWLDDLPRYLTESGGLDSFVLSRFGRRHQTVLIGTISEADLDRLRSDAPQPGPIQQLLDQATVISLMQEERNTANETGPDTRLSRQDDESKARAAADESERERWQRAADAGDTGAMTNLGRLLEDSDPAQARHWYERAADAGDTGAMTNLGRLLEDSDPAQARHWYERAADAGDTGAMTNLAAWMGRAGDAAGARDQYAALLPISERIRGPEHPDTLSTRANLARWTGAAGDAAGARDQYAALLPIAERVRGPEHPDTLNIRGNLAFWTAQAGDAAGARDQFVALLPIVERVLGPEHVNTLTTRANLARWTGAAGDAAGARDQYAALLPISERVRGPEHPDTLTTRGELAFWTGQSGDAAGARDQYAALLPISERIRGPEHPDTLNIRINLARWTGQSGDAAGARDQYAALLPISERVRGPEHPDTLTTRGELAFWTGQSGDAAGARDQYAALLPISERIRGPEHPDTLNIRINLARWTAQAGDAAGARDQYAALLPISERIRGPEHPDTLNIRINLARWTAQAGDAAGARDQYAALLPIIERIRGPEHPDTLTTRTNLARWTGAAGDAAGARDQYAALLPIAEQVLGPEHVNTLTTRANLARWTGAAGDAAGARDQYAALLPISERVRGPEHPDTLNIRGELAFWTGQSGDAAGARDQYAALLPISERVRGPEHPDTLTTRDDLAFWTAQAGDAAGARDQYATLPPRVADGSAGQPLTIFINYRHQDTQGTAWALYTKLEDRFGPDNLFFDRGTLRPGMQWFEGIESRQAASRVFIALIGQRWMSAMTANLQSSSEDYVAKEIELALRSGRGMTVIPVLTDDAELPHPDELPLALRPLLNLQAERLRPTQLPDDIDRLIARLEEIHRIQTPPGTL